MRMPGSRIRDRRKIAAPGTLGRPAKGGGCRECGAPRWGKVNNPTPVNQGQTWQTLVAADALPELRFLHNAKIASFAVSWAAGILFTSASSFLQSSVFLPVLVTGKYFDNIRRDALFVHETSALAVFRPRQSVPFPFVRTILPPTLPKFPAAKYSLRRRSGIACWSDQSGHPHTRGRSPQECLPCRACGSPRRRGNGTRG
jgi:hypothetical protein